MLGFATVDVSTRDKTLTVWLTSVVNVRAASEMGHTNALSIALAEATAPRRGWNMACDRYVVLTERTPVDHPALTDWGVEPCNPEMLAELTVTAQETIMTAFAAHVATKKGKAADLIEPTLIPVPPPINQLALAGGAPEQLTLTVADQVKRVWEAWINAERERVKRWMYMPGGHKDEVPKAFPAQFVKRNAVQAVRAWTA
jgi:hypothetical protein